MGKRKSDRLSGAEESELLDLVSVIYQLARVAAEIAPPPQLLELLAMLSSLPARAARQERSSPALRSKLLHEEMAERNEGITPPIDFFTAKARPIAVGLRPIAQAINLLLQRICEISPVADIRRAGHVLASAASACAYLDADRKIMENAEDLPNAVLPRYERRLIETADVQDGLALAACAITIGLAYGSAQRMKRAGEQLIAAAETFRRDSSTPRRRFSIQAWQLDAETHSAEVDVFAPDSDLQAAITSALRTHELPDDSLHLAKDIADRLDGLRRTEADKRPSNEQFLTGLLRTEAVFLLGKRLELAQFAVLRSGASVVRAMRYQLPEDFRSGNGLLFSKVFVYLRSASLHMYSAVTACNAEVAKLERSIGSGVAPLMPPLDRSRLWGMAGLIHGDRGLAEMAIATGKIVAIDLKDNKSAAMAAQIAVVSAITEWIGYMAATGSGEVDDFLTQHAGFVIELGGCDTEPERHKISNLVLGFWSGVGGALLMRELTGAKLYRWREALKPLVSSGALGNIFSRQVPRGSQSGERVWFEDYLLPYPILDRMQSEGIVIDSVWSDPVKAPERFDNRPLLKRLAGTAWPIGHVVLDIFGALLIREAPHLEDELPQSARQMLDLLSVELRGQLF
jgi:hypothetical protein